MTQKTQALVLDSWAVIAYLEDEPSGQKIADLIASAHEQAIPVRMCVVNAGEVWYIIARAISEEAANDSIKTLHDLRIQFMDADWEITQAAARFRSKNKMSYADCYAAALAQLIKAALVTGDREFKGIEDQVKVHWV